MKKLFPQYFQLPGKSEFEAIVNELAQSFSIRHKPGRVQQHKVFDNFDVSLLRSNVVLIGLTARSFEVFDGESSLNASLQKKVKTGSPLFWNDFQEEAVQSILKKHSRLRALQPLETIRRAIHNYEILNIDEKIIARLTFTLHYSSESGNTRGILAGYVKFETLRGYEAEANALKSQFENSDCKKISEPTVLKLLVNQGFEAPPSPTRKFGLKKSDSAESAFHQMGLVMLNLASSHSQGLIDDIDTEFLHQYRVQLRKLRSLTNLMKSCLPDKTYTDLKTNTRSLFSPTNLLRDLDVLLLERDDLIGLLPSHYEEGLNALFRRIEMMRQQSYRALVKTMKTKRYQEQWNKIETLLRAEPDLENNQSKKTIEKWASKKILSRYQHVCRLGRVIDESTEDEEVHELRKDCKRLRYLMDFYKELFDAKTMKTLIQHVKGLQEILGDFNDYSVQQVLLADVAKKDKSVSLQAAVNALIGVLHQKQIQARNVVQDAFAQFDSSEIEKSIRKLST